MVSQLESVCDSNLRLKYSLYLENTTDKYRYKLNRVGKIVDFGHELGKNFGKRAEHPHLNFLGVSLGIYFVILCTGGSLALIIPLIQLPC